MILARVVGTVWAARRDGRLDGCKLLLVRPYFSYRLGPVDDQLVVVDRLDAGMGDDVLVCFGSPARWQLGSSQLPVDAAVLGVVDRCQFAAASFHSMRALPPGGDQLPRDVEWV